MTGQGVKLPFGNIFNIVFVFDSKFVVDALAFLGQDVARKSRPCWASKFVVHALACLGSKVEDTPKRELRT